MPQTSLGRVTNSASRSFTNSRGAMATVNYGKIVGSYDNYDLAYNYQQTLKAPTTTVTLPVTNNKPCNDVYGGCYRPTQMH